MATLLIFLFVIIILVVAHELGHFFVAKSFGVKVDEFGLGYPPRAKKLFTWRGTLFTLNWLPFGGFVKIFGEDDGKITETPNAFSNQKLWKRLAILVAGITANMLLAIFLYFLSFSIGFLGNVNDFPQAHVVSNQELTIIEVLKDTPAYTNGIKVGDKITTLYLDNDDVAFTPHSTEEFIKYIQTNSTKQIHIGVLRDGSEKFFEMTPKNNVANSKPGIGVGIDEIGVLRMNLWDAFVYGFKYTIMQFKMIIVSICMIVSSLFSGSTGIASQLSGPVGIAKFAGAAYSLGIGSFFAFMALISVNLAVVNLLPFPALDGGRMVLEFFTTKGKSKISPRVIAGINQIGFLLLIILMLWVTYHDIFHPV
jgi:regulator of sigma E protease